MSYQSGSVQTHANPADALAQRQFELRTANAIYQSWLAINGIKDPKARIIFDGHLGYVGVKGDQRREADGQRLYDVLPRELVIEINRMLAGVKPLDPGLVSKLTDGLTNQN